MQNGIVLVFIAFLRIVAFRGVALGFVLRFLFLVTLLLFSRFRNLSLLLPVPIFVTPEKKVWRYLDCGSF